MENISIHAARVGCDGRHAFMQNGVTISIHAARVGCDLSMLLLPQLNRRFQSTQPEWAATADYIKEQFFGKDFNPRSPSGLRPNVELINGGTLVFQSTQPEWAATRISYSPSYL